MKVVYNRFVFTLEEWLPFLKAKYEDGYEDMVQDHPDMAIVVSEKEWDQIKPANLFDVMKIKDLEKRRTVFSMTSLNNIFFERGEVVDVKEVETIQWQFTGDNFDDKVEGKMNNVYELVKLDTSEIFPEVFEDVDEEDQCIYAVRVTCTTTGKQAHIVVSNPLNVNEHCVEGSYDALEALASMTMCPIDKPAYMTRQGDVFNFYASEDAVEVTPYPLTGSQYVSLMRMQS
jgi:hypothetical protein